MALQHSKKKKERAVWSLQLVAGRICCGPRFNGLSTMQKMTLLSNIKKSFQNNVFAQAFFSHGASEIALEPRFFQRSLA